MRLPSNLRERISVLSLILLIEFCSATLLPFVPRDDFYFAACGAFNLFTLSVLTVIGNSEITVDSVKLTFAQLCLQFVGWILYSLYLPPYFYNVSIHAIVAATYIRILFIGSDDGLADNTDGAVVHRHDIQWPGTRHEVHQC